MLTTARSLSVAFCIAVCILVVPLFLVDVPPLADYPNHLARLYLLGGELSDPILSRMYAQHWAIIPNLGIDFFVPWMLSFLPLDMAGRIMLAVTLILPVIGTVTYSRVLSGRWSFWPLGSFLISYNLVFLLGFHNLLLSYGVALLSAALYHHYTRKGILFSDLVAAFCAITVFFVHIAGLALLLALVFSDKLTQVASFWPNRKRAFQRALAHSCGFLIIGLGPVLLYLASPLAESVKSGSFTAWMSAPGKLMFLLGPVLNYYSTLDFVTAGLLVAAFATCMVWGKVRFLPPACIAAVLLFIMYPYLPFVTMTGGFVDGRVPIALGYLAFSTFVPVRMPRPVIAGISASLIALFVLRMGVVAFVWYGHRQDLADLRSTIQPISAGSRVLLVSVTGPGVKFLNPEGDPALQPRAPRSRYVSFLGLPVYEQMPALVLIERHAFWPHLYAEVGQQPLRVLPPYDQLSRPYSGGVPDYDLLAKDAVSEDDLDSFPYLLHWRTDFDYVLLLNAELGGDLSAFLPDRLELLRRTNFTALFRIRK